MRERTRERECERMRERESKREPYVCLRLAWPHHYSSHSRGISCQNSCFSANFDPRHPVRKQQRWTTNPAHYDLFNGLARPPQPQARCAGEQAQGGVRSADNVSHTCLFSPSQSLITAGAAQHPLMRPRCELIHALRDGKNN